MPDAISLSICSEKVLHNKLNRPEFFSKINNYFIFLIASLIRSGNNSAGSGASYFSHTSISAFFKL